MQNADEQYNKMVNTPVWKLITRLAIPTITSMLVTSFYNMADTFFVSQLGTDASAAVGIVFPIMSIIQACGFTLGMGSGSLVSIRLGQKRNQEASEISSTAFFAAFGVGILITCFGNIFARGVLRFAGAGETVLPYAKDYARFIFWGAATNSHELYLLTKLPPTYTFTFLSKYVPCVSVLWVFPLTTHNRLLSDG